MQEWRKSVYLQQQPGTPLAEHLVEAHDAAKFVMQTVTVSTWLTIRRQVTMAVFLAVSTQYTNVTDRQTSMQTPHDGIGRAHA